VGVDAAFVFGLIAVAGALMASNRMRYDVVSLLVVLALMLSGVLTVNQALAGFGWTPCSDRRNVLQFKKV
jgi:di/tricarboxylate transporter